MGGGRREVEGGWGGRERGVGQVGEAVMKGKKEKWKKRRNNERK